MESKAVITREELLGLKVAQDELRKKQEVRQQVETIKRSIIAAALGEKSSYTQDVSGWKFTEDIANALRVMFPDSKVEVSMNQTTRMVKFSGGEVPVIHTNDRLTIDWS